MNKPYTHFCIVKCALRFSKLIIYNQFQFAISIIHNQEFNLQLFTNMCYFQLIFHSLQLFTITLSRHLLIVFRKPDTENKKKKNQRVYRWGKKESPKTNRLPTETVFIPVPGDIDIWTPVKYFKQFWDDNITEMIIKQTNLYSVENSGATINTNKDKTEKFLGIQMLMSMVKMLKCYMH